MHQMTGTFVALTLLTGAALCASAERHSHPEVPAEGRTSENCYDAADQTEIRLWSGRAPGASGDHPCRDIPFLRYYPAARRGGESNTAIIVMPGGGYDRLSDTKEQASVGEYFARALGVPTFVLFYRLVQTDGTYRYPVPMWDGQRAVKLIRSRAASYGIHPHRIGVFGFSAGGHVASTITLHSATDFDLPQHDEVDRKTARPDFLGLGYPVISMLPDQYASPASLRHLLDGYRGPELDRLEHYLSGQEHVTQHTPPVFLFESMDDDRISPQNSVLFANALHAANIAADVHLFAHGVHGAGLAEGIPEEQQWPEMFHQWLIAQEYAR
jgi:acetyl esterase/lipase